ncbi:uncharacterized protein LOC116777297 isoform X2 [Danaus plexippus]|uniref:uncharacterized protein LOC116777297 isoform X2 n=1 Tax=Danaus plexippus TaxID=13037 RepID=UPI0013C45DF5|nr:uncharacterized protein LOC116777297 isoform X2 [Danaus plexippus]
MTVYTENIAKKTLSEYSNYEMSDNRDETELLWAVDDNYENRNRDRNNRVQSDHKQDDGVLASHMSDNMSQGYFLEQRKGNDSASFSEYYLRSPAPPEAFEIGRDFSFDGYDNIECELSRDLNNMGLNHRPRIPAPRPPNQQYYLFETSSNEDGEDCVLSEDSFSYKDMDTTYSP